VRNIIRNMEYKSRDKQLGDNTTMGNGGGVKEGLATVLNIGRC